MDMLFLVFFFSSFPTSQTLFFSFNSSILPVFPASNTAPPSPSSPSSKSFLKEILNAIAAKEQWDPDVDARFSVVETESVRVSAIQTFEFHLRSGLVTLNLKFSDEAETWRKVGKEELVFGPNFVSLDEGFRPGIRVLKLEGPLELHASGDDVFSVHLPSVNITHQDLKQVIVGEGISIEVDSSGSTIVVCKRKAGLQTIWRLNLSDSPMAVTVPPPCSSDSAGSTSLYTV